MSIPQIFSALDSIARSARQMRIRTLGGVKMISDHLDGKFSSNEALYAEYKDLKIKLIDKTFSWEDIRDFLLEKTVPGLTIGINFEYVKIDTDAAIIKLNKRGIQPSVIAFVTGKGESEIDTLIQKRHVKNRQDLNSFINDANAVSLNRSGQSPKTNWLSDNGIIFK